MSKHRRTVFMVMLATFLLSERDCKQAEISEPIKLTMYSYTLSSRSKLPVLGAYPNI